MRVLLIDDGFAGWTGHNAAYNFAICDELLRRSIDYHLFAHHSAGGITTAHANVLPTFKNFAPLVSVKWKFLPVRLNIFARLVAANLGHFIDLLTKVSPHVQNQDIVLICIQSPYTSFAYALWLLYLSMRKIRLVTVFVVHNKPSKILRWEMFSLRILAARHRVILAAHTKPIAELCQQLTGHQCCLLPLPFAHAGYKQHGDHLPQSGSISFAYLGVALVEKGLDIVLGAIGEVEDLLRRGTIELTIQCHVHQESEKMTKLQEALIARAQTTPRMKVITESLSPEEYYTEMDRSDVILIPNRPEFYRLALSGVFTEALARGKPVIVSEDTYMAVELRQNGAGVTFRSGSATALAEAIKTVAARFTEFKERALSAKGAWLDIHNSKRYVDSLLEVSLAD